MSYVYTIVKISFCNLENSVGDAIETTAVGATTDQELAEKLREQYMRLAKPYEGVGQEDLSQVCGETPRGPRLVASESGGGPVLGSWTPERRTVAHGRRLDSDGHGALLGVRTRAPLPRPR